MTRTNPGDGGCQCGNIRYRIHGTPQMLYICHCTDCQKQSASAFGMSLTVYPDQIEFPRGEESLRSWDARGGDGNIKHCYFCPDCGTRVIHGSEDPAASVGIKAGSLNDSRELQPDAHIRLSSAQLWVSVDRERYACFETEPDDRALLKNSGAGENGA